MEVAPQHSNTFPLNRQQVTRTSWFGGTSWLGGGRNDWGEEVDETKFGIGLDEMDFRPLQPWGLIIKANETCNIKEWFKRIFPGCSCCLQALVWTNDILDSVVLVGWRRKNMSKIWTPNWLIVYVHQVCPDVLGYFHGNGTDTGNQPDESFPRILGECVCKELLLTCPVF